VTNVPGSLQPAGAALLDARQPVVGMIHLAPLPGSPRWEGSMEMVFQRALADARTLVEAGFKVLLIENYGDLPFHPHRVPVETAASMTAIAQRLISTMGPEISWGVNVLRNDASTAIAVAGAVGAAFVRVNVHCGATLTDQGILEGQAHETLRMRSRLAPQVQVWADASVKHGLPLAPRPLEDEVRDLVERGLADAVLVTGPRTGAPPDLARLRLARAALAGVPLLAASGVARENIGDLLQVCEGVIVGTSIKEAGLTGAPVDPARARAFLEAVRRARTVDAR